MLQLGRQIDDVVERLTTRRTLSSDAGFDVSSSQRQIDLEVELLERKVWLLLGRAELIGKQRAANDTEHSTREVQVQEVQVGVEDDVWSIRDKWSELLKLVDAARLRDAVVGRLEQLAAEVV